MTPFAREDAPDFWACKEDAWSHSKMQVDPLTWEYKGKDLRAWFHEVVRKSGEPHNCAYCDAQLGVALLSE